MELKVTKMEAIMEEVEIQVVHPRTPLNETGSLSGKYWKWTG